MYIGHWVHRDAIVRRNNHPAIVPQEVFFAAFNYLSPVTLNGQPNPNYRPFRDVARPTKDSHRPVERPFCAGLIFAEVDGKRRQVGTTWIKSAERYVYVANSGNTEQLNQWVKTAHFVDGTVVRLLRDKLRVTFDAGVWEKIMDRSGAASDQDQRRIRAQIAVLDRVMQNQIASLDTLANSQMIVDVQDRYEAAQAERQRLLDELALLQDDVAQQEAIAALHDTIGPVLEQWEDMTRQEIRLIMKAFIERIEATQAERALDFTIHWRDESTDSFSLPKQMENGWREWLPSEFEQLRNLVEAGATQVEIARAFPDRTWRMIVMKIRKDFGRIYFSPQPIRHKETYVEYQSRTEQHGGVYIARSSDFWTPEDDKRLLEMVYRDVEQIEIAASFPHRKWGRIRARITKLKGTGVAIRGIGAIPYQETYAMYLAKLDDTSVPKADNASIDSGDQSSTVARMPSCWGWNSS